MIWMFLSGLAFGSGMCMLSYDMVIEKKISGWPIMQLVIGTFLLVIALILVLV